MNNFYRLIFVTAAMVLTFPCEHNNARTIGEITSGKDVGVSGLSWNLRNNEAPFQHVAGNARSEFVSQIVYPNGDFALPLFQSLSFDPDCDCYGLIVSTGPQTVLEIVHFWRTRSGFYRTANGPYLELENIDSLRAVTALNGTRFLFAQVGDGEWRCVSIHDPAGSYLLIDYRADGLIDRLRDSFARVALPAYDGGRLISLSQRWTNHRGQPMRSIVQ